MSDRPASIDGAAPVSQRSMALSPPVMPRELHELTSARLAGPPTPAQQLPLPGLAVGFSMTNTSAEAEILKKLTPEHISLELSQSHTRMLRALDIQEKALGDERQERELEHQRDQRDRDEQKGSDSRLERMFYLIFVVLALISGALILKDKEDLAVKLVIGFVGLLVSVAGGIGVERLRQERISRRKRQRKLPSAEKDE